MDYSALVLLLSFVCIVIFSIISIHSNKSTKPFKLPPGPHPYPIIGNILELGTNPLKSFTHLSKTYGPIMTLKLGSITTIVISSPQIAKEALSTNDQVFSNRTTPDATRALDHYKVSVVWMPSSPKWRNLRRVCATKIFSPQQLDSTQFHRKRKVQDLLNYVNECCMKGEALDIGEAIFTTVLNSVSNTFFSLDLFHYGHGSDDDKSHHEEFKEIIFGVMEEAGRPNVSDFFPFFRLFDLQGARARMINYCEKFFAFMDGVLEERTRLRASGTKKYNDVLDSILDLIKEESSQLSRQDVLHLFLVSISTYALYIKYYYQFFFFFADFTYFSLLFYILAICLLIVIKFDTPMKIIDVFRLN